MTGSAPRGASAILASHLPLALALVAVLPVLWPPLYLGDHFTFWAAGHLVATGRSPYDDAAWREIAESPAARSGVAINLVVDPSYRIIWAYPPWTALLFLPFGALPIEIGVPLLHATYIGLATVAAIALARSMPWLNLRTSALALVFFALFLPFVIATRSGHFDGLLLAGVPLVLFALQRDRAWPLIAGALLLSLKPHPVVLLAPAALGVLLVRRRWRHVVATGLTLAVVAGVSFAAYPEALPAIATAIAERSTTRGGTPWTFASALAPGYSTVVVAALLAMVILAPAFAAWRAPPALRLHTLTAAALVTTLGVVPYAQVHDQLLLLPAVFVTVLRSDFLNMHRGLYLAGLFIAVIIVPWFLVLRSVIEDSPDLSGVMPALVAALLLAAWLLPERPLGRLSSR